MKYITRELERKFLKLNDFFKVILVTGARQVGKTTMLKHLAAPDRTYVTMDNAMARELAQSDPVLFFQTYKPPILIDEVQKAPELFEQIKLICDESDEKGQIWDREGTQHKHCVPSFLFWQKISATSDDCLSILHQSSAQNCRAGRCQSWA